MKREVNILVMVLAFAVSLVACRQRDTDLSGLQDAGDPTKPQSHFIEDADGTIIHFYTLGTPDRGKSTVMLLHGAGLDGHIAWVPNGVAERLARKYFVIALDQRGHGLSGGHIEQPLAIYRDPIMVLDYLRIKKAHFHGYSFGGQTLAGLMKFAPERIISATFGGAGIAETFDYTGTVPAEPDPTSTYQVIEDDANLEIKQLNEKHTTEIAQRKATPPTRVETCPKVTIDETLAQVEIDLTKIDFPVLSLIGEFDLSVANTHRMERELKNYRKVVFPERGHVSLVTPKYIPALYLDSLSQFIDRAD